MTNMMTEVQDQNWDDVETGGQPFDPLPIGEYVVEITKTNYGKNKKGTGMVLEIETVVLDGDYNNRRIYESFNTAHENPQTAEIGMGQLKGLALALGMPAPSPDPREYERKPFVARVKITPATEKYAAKNGISAYKPASEYDESRTPRKPRDQEKTSGGWTRREDRGGDSQERQQEQHQSQSGGSSGGGKAWERD